jgi:hypothetical protein
MSKLNDEIATGLDAAKQNAIDVEGVRVGDDVARVEGDADAAILEADAMRQAQKEAVTAEAGRVEAEKAAAAGEKLTWKEWVDKNYPEGRGSKRQQTLINEYNKYKKDIIEEGVATYKDPGIPYKPITLASKVFRRSLQNIKHAAPQAGGRLERFVDLWDNKKADWIG